MKSLVKLLFILISLALATGYLSAQSLTHGNFVVIIDKDLPNVETLTAGIRPGAKVVYLDPSVHPLVDMNKIIRENAPISSLHILSHGKSGALIFSSQEFSTSTIERHEELFGSWKEYFTHHGDILLYAGEVGKGDEGLSFVNSLAVMTGLDVAASNDLTGASVKGGDWLLEVRSGNIESLLILSKQIRGKYPSLLGKISNRKMANILVKL